MAQRGTDQLVPGKLPTEGTVDFDKGKTQCWFFNPKLTSGLCFTIPTRGAMSRQ
jgi:hypothetical protein